MISANNWSTSVAALPVTTATQLGPKALTRIQSKYAALDATAILKERIQWAKETPYLKLSSDAIPEGILPPNWSGVLHEIKVNPRGYGKRKGPPTDDAVYENEEKVRRLVPRGCCFVELTIVEEEEEEEEEKEGKEGKGSERKKNDNNDNNKNQTKNRTHVILPGIFAMRKFSGGLGDEDDDNKHLHQHSKGKGDQGDQGEEKQQPQPQPEKQQHAEDRWSKFFTRPYEDATVVVAAKKANGEAAHASCVRLPNGQLLTLCGSKHVHLAYIEPAQIDLYANVAKYTMASVIAKTFARETTSAHASLLSLMADTGLTACFEIEQPASMHVEMFDFKEPRLQFLAFTSADIGTKNGEKRIAKATVAATGQCLPPVYGYIIASTFGLTPVAYTTHPMSQVKELITNVRRRHGDEGDVLYFVAEDGETIGLVKTKTVWYVVARAIREKMRTMISKATKITQSKPVKGFWNAKQGMVDQTTTTTALGSTKTTTLTKKQQKKMFPRGTKYVPPTPTEIQDRLCELTVASVGRRIEQLQVWLKFNDSTKMKFQHLGSSFVRWAMKKYQSKLLVLNNVANQYPVLWLAHLKETNLNDRFTIYMIGEEEEEEEEENECLSATMSVTPSDFSTFELNGGTTKMVIHVTTKMPPAQFTPLFDDAWTGSHVWGCSILLANYLLENNLLVKTTASGEDDGQPKCCNVLELGAGVGLVSLMCAKFGCRVVCSDQPMLLETMKTNREYNQIDSKQLQIIPLVWKELQKEDALVHDMSCDVVLVSDCLNPIYGEQNITDLAHALSILLVRTEMVCYVAYEERDEDAPSGSSGTTTAKLNLYQLMCQKMGSGFESTTLYANENRYIYRLVRL